MQLNKLFPEFDRLQKIHGDSSLDAIYGCGNINNPKICLVFMNPTARNVASTKQWTGIKAPWLGTKNVWKMFFQLNLINKKIFNEINKRKPTEWDYKFSDTIYKNISEQSIYITNLSKATQIDARPLPNDVFREYLDLFKSEISNIKPKVIITFGNQVSSVLLNKNIKVSEYRKRFEPFEINENIYKVFPVFYPVGQGTRNVNMAREDIDWIIKNSN